MKRFGKGQLVRVNFPNQAEWAGVVKTGVLLETGCYKVTDGGGVVHPIQEDFLEPLTQQASPPQV